jgi:probable F420-dependent oxidoreductase
MCIPQIVEDGAFDPARFRAYLTRVEALGFDSAWTQEQSVGATPHLAPLEVMSYAAACTERLRIGCAVFVSSLNSPVHLAKAISSLDQLSRGRVEVGFGVGGRTRMLSAFGVDPDSLSARFTEGLNLMKAVWTEPRITFKGRFWQVDGAAVEPKPFQKPYPRVWLGGGAPAAVRRAVRRADGFFGAGSTTTAQFAEQVKVVRTTLAEDGRDAAGFPIAKRVYITVDDDAERGRQRMSDSLRQLYGSFGLPDLTPVSVYGPPEACVRGLREVADAGAELIQLHPLSDEAEQMERLAAEVVPQLP